MGFYEGKICENSDRIATALERIADNLDILVGKKSLLVNDGEPMPPELLVKNMNIPVEEPINIEKLLSEKEVYWEDSPIDLSRLVISRIPLTQKEKDVLVRMWRASGYTRAITFSTRDCYR